MYGRGYTTQAMCPSPAVRPGRRPVIAFALLLAVASACTGDVVKPRPVVTRIELQVPAFTLRPGDTMRVVGAPVDANDEPVNVPVHWTSVTPALLEVSPTGLLRGLAPGTGIARATAGTKTVNLAIDLVNPPVASLGFDDDTLFLLLPGGGLPLPLQVVDAADLPIIGAPLAWSSDAPRIATVSATGVVTPIAVGRATISVTVEGLTAELAVIVDPFVTMTSPVIVSVTPSKIVPGVPVVILGQRFGATPGANIVLADGVPLTVTAASATQLTAQLPAGGAHCLPTGVVALQVTTGGGVGAAPVTLQTATQRALEVGEALVLTSAAASTCNELDAGTGRYLMAVSNGARAFGAGPIGVSLAGTTGGAAPPLAQASPLAPPMPALRQAPWSPGAARAARRARTHQDLAAATRAHLDANRRALVAPHRGGEAALQMPTLNGIVPVRIPNLDSQGFCDNFIAIDARAVYIGPHIVILEDTSTVVGGAPMLAGQMDTAFVTLGDEVEGVIWPIITTFGDPLVMDNALDGNGRVFLVFSPRMNVLRQGAVLGAVVSCDFFQRAQFPSSNVGEVFYAQVPFFAGPGTGSGTIARWRHEMRSVIAHELKHVVSYAERIARSRPLEEFWLEEATARHAEELYARAVYGLAQGGNTAYAAALRCEALFAVPGAGCDDAPQAMLAHFEGLWTHLDDPAGHSPLGGALPGDLSFYGSAWALTRWALDHRALPEEQLLRDFTLGGQNGLANLEARAGMPWDEMLGRWALAMLTDGRPGFAPLDARLTFPSWDLTSNFNGLCLDLGPCNAGPSQHPLFSRAYPAHPVQAAAGAFTVAVPVLQPGGFQPVELSGGTALTRQLLHLRGLAGGPLPATARLAIVRVE